MRRPPALACLLAALAGLALTAGPAPAHDELAGELYGVHADYFAGGRSDTRWRLDTGTETLRVLPTSVPALTPQSNAVEVSGREEEGTVVGSVQPASLSATPALGGRRLAVIAINFSADPSTPWTVAQLRERVFTAANSTSAFFREESHDRLWLDGDVYGWYTLGASNASCSYGGWANQAKAAAAADGFDAADYDHVMYVFPRQPACGWAGLAYMPGSESWINGELTVRVTGHEIGHNLGLNHAGSWDCTSGGASVTLSSSCSINEYNDPFDNMGAYGHRHSHGWHLERLGLLEPSNVQTISASGTYALTSALEPTSAATTLRIPRTRGAGGSVLDWYYLEVRERGGVFDDFSLSDPAVTGVSIRVNDDPSQTTRSKLLDTHPGHGGISNAPLAPGEIFRDDGLSVTAVSAGDGAATVRIDLPGDPGDTQAPTAPADVAHDIAAGGQVALRWSPSSDDTAVTEYAVYRDGAQIASSGTPSLVDAGAGPGSHVYTVYASDAARNRSFGSSPYTVDVAPRAVAAGPAGAARRGGPVRRADRRAPVIRLARSRAGDGRLVFRARARDAGGVARLALYLDGRRVRAAARARLRYAWRLRAGRHRVLVRALDRAGNSAEHLLRLRVTR